MTPKSAISLVGREISSLSQMANEKEVKAQVRLRFWNLNRHRMTATRNLQVTMKKTGGLTFKTLEGILAKADEGDNGKVGEPRVYDCLSRDFSVLTCPQRNTISTKCSEMDEEVPLLLGVSKAILENVIFCHQEESNWPLSEPAALKKKFDDIFEATKWVSPLLRSHPLDAIPGTRKPWTTSRRYGKSGRPSSKWTRRD